MNKYLVMTMMVVVFAITGCDKGADTATPSSITGTYVAGKSTYIFSPNGEVTSKGTPLFPKDEKTTYKVEGGKLNMKFSEGYPMTFSIKPDGSLSLEPLHDVVFKKVD
ncbi:hypothetical protein [Acidovorax carolinensis]|uniref:hypothetical protein n=1 Tax=Acidovorax carolinensis TaxID=553814 RepID=UPI0012FF8C3B|nr:hypothetical protein [Acidovorax carolinensis]